MVENVSLNTTETVDAESFTETQKILTPFAFEVNKSLFGLSLASPLRRLLAIIIDISLVAILSSAPGELLALVVSVTLYKLANRKYNAQGNLVKRGLKRMMYLLATFILLVSLLSILPPLFSYLGFSEQQKAELANKDIGLEQELNFAQGVAGAALTAKLWSTIEHSQCAQLLCWQQELTPFITTLTEFSLSEQAAIGLIEAMVEPVSLANADKEALIVYLTEHYKSLTTKPVQDLIQESKQLSTELLPNEQAKTEPAKAPVYSLVAWTKAIINDLGLGFGWAAFYFTVLTALWHGQTPGKKLLAIKVLQLDGTPLSLWDSFGRYGGYGAGIATGLLGFLQIYWDPNRQAIHDKISATVVIHHKVK